MIQNKLWLIPIMLLLSLTTIFAVPETCWEVINCGISGSRIPSGAIVYPSYYQSGGPASEEMCEMRTITIPSTSVTGTIKIRIQQGGDSGTVRNIEYPLNATSPIITDVIPIIFYLDKSTTPTYIYCVDVLTHHPEHAGFGTEINTLQTWVASYGLNYMQFINPVPKANDLPTPSAVTGTIINTNAGTVALTGIPTTYTNLLYGNVHSTITGTYCGDGFCESSKGEDVFSCIPDCSFGGSHIEFNPISTDVSGMDANVTLDGNVVIPTYTSVTQSHISYPADSANPGVYAIAILFSILGFLGMLFVIGSKAEWF